MDIQAGISTHGHLIMDIHTKIISERISILYGYQSLIIRALWISIWILNHFYRYPCMGFLWTLELVTWLFGINPYEVIG